jgi:hypothetical protein
MDVPFFDPRQKQFIDDTFSSGNVRHKKIDSSHHDPFEVVTRVFFRRETQFPPPRLFRIARLSLKSNLQPCPMTHEPERMAVNPK